VATSNIHSGSAGCLSECFWGGHCVCTARDGCYSHNRDGQCSLRGTKRNSQ